MVWLTAFGVIFNVRTAINVCDCTRGLYGHGKSLHWKLTGRKHPLPHRGLEPASALLLAFQSDALPTELFAPLFLYRQSVLKSIFDPFSRSDVLWHLFTQQLLTMFGLLAGKPRLGWPRTQPAGRQPWSKGENRIIILHGAWRHRARANTLTRNIHSAPKGYRTHENQCPNRTPHGVCCCCWSFYIAFGKMKTKRNKNNNSKNNKASVEDVFITSCGARKRSMHA